MRIRNLVQDRITLAEEFVQYENHFRKEELISFPEGLRAYGLPVRAKYRETEGFTLHTWTGKKEKIIKESFGEAMVSSPDPDPNRVTCLTGMDILSDFDDIVTKPLNNALDEISLILNIIPEITSYQNSNSNYIAQNSQKSQQLAQMNREVSQKSQEISWKNQEVSQNTQEIAQKNRKITEVQQKIAGLQSIVPYNFCNNVGK